MTPRLVDANALTDRVREAIAASESVWTHYGWVQKLIDTAPTVIVKTHEGVIYNDEYHIAGTPCRVIKAEDLGL